MHNEAQPQDAEENAKKATLNSQRRIVNIEYTLCRIYAMHPSIVPRQPFMELSNANFVDKPAAMLSHCPPRSGDMTGIPPWSCSPAPLHLHSGLDRTK